ncbi:type VII secretion system-associated protein [Streptomyces varsoviensis]|uniref:type VII secretion system-associated protein n=1 Tax=Streptomyces varsoviensis TaxID=67373 RepID=UPI0033EADBDF
MSTGSGTGARTGTDARTAPGTGAGGAAGRGAPPAMPPAPEDIREAARTAPDHWFAMTDPAWTGAGAPPSWAVIGQWRSDARGDLVGWQDNPDYRPSPGMLGWPEPTDDVDAAIQSAATGYGPPEAVARAAATAELAVFTAPGGGPVVACAPDGGPVVPAYTGPAHLERAGALAHQVLPADQLFAMIPDGCDLYLNPTGPAPMRLTAADFEEVVAGAGGEAGEETVEALAPGPPGGGAPGDGAPADDRDQERDAR